MAIKKNTESMVITLLNSMHQLMIGIVGIFVLDHSREDPRHQGGTPLLGDKYIPGRESREYYWYDLIVFFIFALQHSNARGVLGQLSDVELRIT